MQEKLQKISSWEALFNYKEILSELQKEFPSGNGKPYNKSFFIKLNRLVSAREKFIELKDSIEYNTTNAKKARQEFIAAARECAIEKLRHNGEISEIKSINSRYARAKLKQSLLKDSKLADTAVNDFYTDKILKEYATYKVIEYSKVLSDIDKISSKYQELDNTDISMYARTEISSPDEFLRKQKADYINNPKNQWRLTVRAADKLINKLKSEIQEYNNQILDYRLGIAEFNDQYTPSFSNAPLSYLKNKFSYFIHYIKFGFKISSYDITGKNIKECKDKISDLQDKKNLLTKKIRDIKKSKLIFPGLRSYQAKNEFLFRVADANAYFGKKELLSPHAIGLNTSIEISTYVRALDRICENAAKNSDIQDLSEKFDILLYAGADINEQIIYEKSLEIEGIVFDESMYNISLLEYAVLNNKEKLAIWLLDQNLKLEENVFRMRKGANINDNHNKNLILCPTRKYVELLLNPIYESGRKSAIHYIAQNGHIDLLETILEKRKDINLQDEDGKTALHYAVENGRTNAVKFLLERGINKQIKDKNNKTASSYADNIIKHHDTSTNNADLSVNIRYNHIIEVIKNVKPLSSDSLNEQGESPTSISIVKGNECHTMQPGIKK